MFRDHSQIERIPADLDQFLAQEEIYFEPDCPLSDLPLQRCSDANYIKDQQVLDYYRNLHYKLIEHADYENPIIGTMVKTACWLVTSMSEKGVKSGLNIQWWNQNIHPGLKRYIVANYLQLDSVPVLWQGVDRGKPIRDAHTLYGCYGNRTDISVKLRNKGDRRALEVSWHGETQQRDSNGYDFWAATALEELDHGNYIYKYLLTHGLQVQADVPGYTINSADVYITRAHRAAHLHDFYLELPDSNYLQEDLWQLYFHFDPRVGVKTCRQTGIRIVNKRGDPDWEMEVELLSTLKRPWLLDPEKLREQQNTTK